jgi:hypothetical protein
MFKNSLSPRSARLDEPDSPPQGQIVPFERAWLMPNDHSWRMLTQEGIAEAGLERENVRDPAWLLAFLRGIPRADRAELEAAEPSSMRSITCAGMSSAEPDYLRLNPQGLLPALELDVGATS